MGNRVYRRRSRTTSIPSSNRYSSRALISSRSSAAKVPASSRLYSSQNPSRSHTSIFTRLRWRLKNTNTWPDNGSWRRTSCTCALSRSNDRRRSVAPRATKTRTDTGSVSMWSAGPGAPAAACVWRIADFRHKSAIRHTQAARGGDSARPYPVRDESGSDSQEKADDDCS